MFQYLFHDANYHLKSLCVALFLTYHFYLKDNFVLIPSLEYPSFHITFLWPLSSLHENLSAFWGTGKNTWMEQLR